MGLIVVDEEHEGTYKQDNTPAIKVETWPSCAKTLQGPVIVGSATPALESWQNSLAGKYRLHTLYKRPLDYNLPEVKLLDRRDEEHSDLLSSALVAAIDQRLPAMSSNPVS
jgi:primosomal protein N' (replication factor Y)